MEKHNVTTQKTLNSRRFRNVKVSSAIWLNSKMRRIFLTGEELIDFSPLYPGQWVMVRVVDASGIHNESRAYTIRNYNCDEGILVIDFVIHGHGPLSLWALNASTGDSVQVSNPRSSFKVSQDSDWLFLAGDETGLPAILAIMEKCPSHLKITAFIEVSSRQEAHKFDCSSNWSLTWLVRQPNITHGVLLEKAVEIHKWGKGNGQIWISCESKIIKRLRKYLIEQKMFSKSELHLSGYWKEGVSDEREELSDY